MNKMIPLHNTFLRDRQTVFCSSLFEIELALAASIVGRFGTVDDGSVALVDEVDAELLKSEAAFGFVDIVVSYDALC